MKLQNNFLNSRSVSRLLSLSLFILAASAAASTHAQVIYQNDFDQHTRSRTYNRSDLDSEWNSPEWEDGIRENRVQIKKGSQAYGGEGCCLAVSYPKEKHGTRDTGAQWIMELDDEYEEVYLTYSVKFKRGFDFVKGGKLPGLAGGTAPTGNTSATGYNGWTARWMWRTFFNGTPGAPKQKRTKAISYAKFYKSGHDRDGKDEDETVFQKGTKDFSFSSNQWYEVTQRVKLNDHWKDNGILQIWVNDVLVLDQQNIRFRKTKRLKIDKLYFSTFFGGGSSWRTSKSETAYFDNFMIVAID